MGEIMGYHKYVFDEEKKVFLGEFEKMYQAECSMGFDSWQQEDISRLPYQLSLRILAQYNYESVLDIGCGKGVFTCLLKKGNNYVMGVDISPTAIRKAKIKYPGINFTVGRVEEITISHRKFSLIVAMELLSYVKEWASCLEVVSKLCQYFYLTLYLPKKPIGYIKTFDELKTELSKWFAIETEVLLDKENIFLLCKSNFK